MGTYYFIWNYPAHGIRLLPEPIGYQIKNKVPGLGYIYPPQIVSKEFPGDFQYNILP